MVRCFGTRRKSAREELFVLEDKTLEQAVLGRYVIEGIDVESAKLFNVDRAAFLSMSISRWFSRCAENSRGDLLCLFCGNIEDNNCLPELSP